ncbi:hypothetical protein FYJ38_00010 [Clostridium sp. WB02_MRS01]|uniref:hypothetical protein n=1 Tax=Clostridium sp. WB02_MRS01 TaxID=2605777 RepID=UPI0012B409C4|nr:hypothetical protein [Clostridium sp. WB02_MRS01]MSS07023.1 hypothetical protein [Clostridium sp. WB02_MRS01]
MIRDYKNKIHTFENPAEEIEHKNHMAEYGSSTGKSHPDDCPYCKARGWETFPGTSFEEECEKYAEENEE